MLSAIIRPRAKAFDELFFVLFNFHFLVAQPLVVWQCMSSLVNMYSHVIRGLRPFVTPTLRMVKICGTRLQGKVIATASTIFAIEIWRAAMIVVARNRSALSVPLNYFILGEASPSIAQYASSRIMRAHGGSLRRCTILNRVPLPVFVLKTKLDNFAGGSRHVWLCGLSGVARLTCFLQDKTAKTNLLFARQNCQDKLAFCKTNCQDKLAFCKIKSSRQKWTNQDKLAKNQDLP